MKNFQMLPDTLPDPPRAVRTTTPAWVLRFLYVTCMLLPLVAVVDLFTTNIRDDLRLEHGPRVVGTVVDAYIAYDTHNHPLYRLKVKFPANGSHWTERVKVSEDEYDRNPIGSQPLVTYTPQDPSVVRLGVMTPAKAAKDIATQAGIFLVMAAFLIGMVGVIEVLIQTSLTLLKTGRPATATVEGIKPGDKGSKTVSYSFQAEGSRWTGSGVYAAAWKIELAVGDKIPILYLPGKPQKSRPIACIQMAALRSRSIFERV